MTISYNLINEIFKTLPIGYYLGRRITHILDPNSNSSYFVPAKDEVVVGYLMILRTLEQVLATKADLSKEEIEELERTILYHEISHVILTPNMNMNRIINIVEDERIETIFRNYFLNTNFRKVVRMVNNYQGEPPADVDEAFYHLVRFRVGDTKWLEKLVALLNAHKNLTSKDSGYNKENNRWYDDDIMNFYKEFCDEWNANNNIENPGNENETGSESESNSSDNNGESNSPENSDMDTPTTPEAPEDSENESSESNNNEASSGSDKPQNGEGSENTDEESDVKNDNFKDETSDFEEDILNTNDIIKEAISRTINLYNNESLTSTLRGVVDRKLKQNKRNGAAISSYSGVLDKRAVAKRDDYRWWTTPNREGNIRRFSNIHFNLFIDNSGSFRENDVMMNTFIRSLDKISKAVPQFTFDVITINNKEVAEWPDHNQIFRSYCGSAMRNTIKDVIKRHDKRNAEVYTIVLFDGDIHCSDKTKAGDPNDALRHFNRPNTIIISDEDNKCYLDAIKMNKAKVKYVENYCEEFINTIINLLEKAI